MEENKALPYFFLGLGIGVALGILFAPKSGEETRGFIKAKAGEGRDYLKRRTTELRETAAEAVERGKTAITRQKEQLKAALDAGKQAYHEAVSSGAATEEN